MVSEDALDIGVVGLGYVGLGLALALGQHFNTVGYDTDEQRIKRLKQRQDDHGEVGEDVFLAAQQLVFTTRSADIGSCNVFIIAMSTPVDGHNAPDLSRVIEAAQVVGLYLVAGDTVVLESTVYPGFTERDFAQTLEQASGLRASVDFKLGYSPERINPADVAHSVTLVTKVISAMDETTLCLLRRIYGKIITAGIVEAQNIKTAELSKLIENTQRDINIAFINEMRLLANSLELDFDQVLACARSKWNFVDFRPGLVGGHCVAVDPYYLIHSQKALAVPSTMTEAARFTNEAMVTCMAAEFIKKLTLAGLQVKTLKVLVIGITFKPDCPDCRNSKALAVVEELQTFGLEPDIYDPLVSPAALSLSCPLHQRLPTMIYDAILLLVPHQRALNEIRQSGHQLLNSHGVFHAINHDHQELFQ
ncbi:MAG: UDP-N-acetyl-D-galactosamine dehydrogenase [Phenylobacterium sp.]|jgi:UDP-N-acetyl-D-galactosamine dehydrogenase